MKKFKYVLLLILIVIGISVYNISDFSNSASTHEKITSQSSSSSMGEFTAEKDSVIKVNYSSDVKDGTLQLCIKNSKDDIVKDFPVNSKASEKITMDDTDTYKLIACYKDFTGSFDFTAKK